MSAPLETVPDVRATVETVVAEPAPLRRFAWLAFAVLLTIGGSLLLWQFRSVVLLLAAALVLAAMIRPVVDWLAARGLAHGFAATLLVLVIVIGLLALLGLSGYVLAEDLPRAVTQFEVNYAQLRHTMSEQPGWQGTLGNQLPPLEGIEDLVAQAQLNPAQNGTGAVQESAVALPALLDDVQTPAAGADTATNTPSQGGTPAANAPAEPSTAALRASGILRLFVSTTSSILEVLTQFIVLVFLSLYWLIGHEWFERLWLSLLPPDKRRGARTGWNELDRGVGAHVRSELVQVILAFVLLYIGFRLMGADFPLLMAWAAALAWLIPLVGWIVALAPVVVLGLLTSPTVAVGAALYLTIVFGLLEFGVEPRLDVRRRAGSILGLVVALVMLQAFGIVGLLFAGPVAVGVDILVARWQAQTSKPAPQPATDAADHLQTRVAELRAAMGQLEDDVPLHTRSLYERLQKLVIEAEKVL